MFAYRSAGWSLVAALALVLPNAAGAGPVEWLSVSRTVSVDASATGHDGDRLYTLREDDSDGRVGVGQADLAAEVLVHVTFGGGRGGFLTQTTRATQTSDVADDAVSTFGTISFGAESDPFDAGPGAARSVVTGRFTVERPTVFDFSFRDGRSTLPGEDLEGMIDVADVYVLRDESRPRTIDLRDLIGAPESQRVLAPGTYELLFSTQITATPDGLLATEQQYSFDYGGTVTFTAATTAIPLPPGACGAVATLVACGAGNLVTRLRRRS